MKKSSKNILIAMLLSVNISPSMAELKPYYDLPGATSFLFVENNVDNNVFIQSVGKLSPRITGGNSWTSLKGTKQDSLGYASMVDVYVVTDYNVDMWEDGPVPYPYINQRCKLGYRGCDSESHAINKPQVVDKNGFYGLMGGAYGWANAIISPSFYRYLQNMTMGQVLSRTVNVCYTSVAYDARGGARCKDQKSGIWGKSEQQHTKAGHLRFLPNNIFSELIIDSNGNPFVLPGSQGCEAASIKGDAGAICRVLDYDLQHNGAKLGHTDFKPEFKKSALATKISSSDLRFSVDKVTWKNYTADISVDELKGHNAVYLFLSTKLLKAMTTLGLSNPSTRDLLYFSMRNHLAPESGFYEFGLSADIVVKPREFSVSILSADGVASPYREGNVGRDILSFPYNISDTGPTSANALNISVSQDSGSPYQGHCTFYPAGQITAENAVPVPTRLVFNSASRGDNYKHPIRCDGTPVNIRPLGIKDSQPMQSWTDTAGNTTVTRFRTLALEFDLTDPMVQRTATGKQWEGNAGQSGTITLSGVWN